MYFKSEEQYEEYNKALGHDSQERPRALRAPDRPSRAEPRRQPRGHHPRGHAPAVRPVHDEQARAPRCSRSGSRKASRSGSAEATGYRPKDGSWTYETGVLLDGRLDEWNTLAESEFTLADLLNQTYAKRNEYLLRGGEGQKKIGLVYAQGWFLIYFLNHFNVDETGMVKIAAKGKYADGWNEYLKAELAGKTGKKVFMECLKVDDAAIENMNKEYKAYFDFVRRSATSARSRRRSSIPWDQYVNKVGKKTGEKEDDMLIDVRKKIRPAPSDAQPAAHRPCSRRGASRTREPCMRRDGA